MRSARYCSTLALPLLTPILVAVSATLSRSRNRSSSTCAYRSGRLRSSDRTRAAAVSWAAPPAVAARVKLLDGAHEHLCGEILRVGTVADPGMDKAVDGNDVLVVDCLEGACRRWNLRL